MIWIGLAFLPFVIFYVTCFVMAGRELGWWESTLVFWTGPVLIGWVFLMLWLGGLL